MSIRDPETIGISPRARSKTFGRVLVHCYDHVRQDHSFVDSVRMQSAPFRFAPWSTCEAPDFHPYIAVLFR